MSDSRERFESAILTLLEQRDAGKSICPSEAARVIDPVRWRDHMEAIRNAARTLARRGLIEISQRGATVDPDGFRGPVRLRKPGEDRG